MTLDKAILWTLGIFAAFFLIALISTADAQPIACPHSRADLVEMLGSRFNEQQVGVGTISQSALIELFRSDEGSFSIIMSMANGSGCIIAYGRNWTDVPKPKPTKENSF